MGSNPVKSVEKGDLMKRADIIGLFPDATDEQIKALMDINGADINKAKQNVDDLQTKLTEAAATITELQKGVSGLEEAQTKAKQFETELNELRTANAIREIREKVSKATGVPAALLTATSEDDCTAQANSIMEFAKPSAYPEVRDGGEVGGINKVSTRDQFAEWFNNQQ